MRSSSILSISTIAAESLAGIVQPNTEEVNDLFVRTIDPKTMDSDRLSVLSVLKTAIASNPTFPRPTCDFEPEWYQKLPEEVKQILPSLYPAATDTSVSASAESAGSGSTLIATFTSQVTITKTLHHVPSGTAGYAVPSNSSCPAVPNSVSQTVASISPSTSMLASDGVQAALRVEEMTVYAWFGLATAFFLFA